MDWDALLSVTLLILGVAALVLFNGFFVAAEFSLVKVRDTQLSPLVHQGHRRAQAADYILRRLDAFLSAAQHNRQPLSAPLQPPQRHLQPQVFIQK